MLRAQARFDLPGPTIDVRVTRGGSELPIASVPNLQAGDKIWLHPALPPSQSVHYLLIASFLRGTTNPPPDDWFIRIETWNKKVRDEGVFVTVPAEAQQAILFLAPETGGDFGTLRSAVKGRPGIFVRASQDLIEAGFEQARIEKYLASIKQVPPGDAVALAEHSNLLARTLNLRPNPDCFKRDPTQQYTCLTQTGTQTLLDDGHAQSIVAALSNGPGSDFINAASYTRLAAGGNYSAYVGALVDLARLMNGIHTAKYQYIPAIAFPDAVSSSDSLNLRLNTPPSFNNPKSVIVIGLPPVQPAVPPPLRPVDAAHIACLLDPHLALPIEGAPLVFSTAYAHDLVLHLDQPGGASRNLPLMPDAYQGGLTLAAPTQERRELPPVIAAVQPVPAPSLGTAKAESTKSAAPAVAGMTPGAPTTGTIRGFWGFEPFTGPTVALQQVPGNGWKIAKTSQPAVLIAGQPNHVQLLATGTACIRSISLEPGDTRLDWKLDVQKPSTDSTARTAAPLPTTAQPVDLTLNLENAATPGSIRLAIQQFGRDTPDQVGSETFAEPARIDSLQIHAGDDTVLLTGTSLDQVKSLVVRDVAYTPQRVAAPSDKALTLALARDVRSQNYRPSERLSAEVHLLDGRSLATTTSVLPPRPVVTLLSRRIANGEPSNIQLASINDLALGSQLIFFLKSRAPFPRSEQIEIANDPPAEAPDQVLRTTLSIAAGSLVLQDPHTVLATFDPLKTFGPSTFGPFRFRALAADGTAGEWQPLATIVRLPVLTGVTCPADPAASCTLSGTSLYLIQSLAVESDSTTPTLVPEGFVESTLAVPRQTGMVATFYLRLRDDPDTAQQVALPLQLEQAVPLPARIHAGRAVGAPPARP